MKFTITLITKEEVKAKEGNPKPIYNKGGFKGCTPGYFAFCLKVWREAEIDKKDTIELAKLILLKYNI